MKRPAILLLGGLIISGIFAAAVLVDFSSLFAASPAPQNTVSQSGIERQPIISIPNASLDSQPTIAPPDINQPLPDVSAEVYASELDVITQGGAGGGINAVPEGYTPLSVGVPQAASPWDHFYFIRPVAADGRNTGLLYYPYGTRGSNDSLRVHHGIDISNPIGVEILAAGSGTVIWADEGHYDENTGEAITTYGNTVVIAHDFGFDGNALFTLYAHMSALLVEAGDFVQAGDVIGLIGDTGQVTGPHVHFEVRYGQNRYRDTRNPDLWIAPYEGTGVVAGRVEVPNLQYADIEVTLKQCGTTWVVAKTMTYAGPVLADDNWNENFVLPNVPVGCYVAEASFGEINWYAEIQVLEGILNWAEMVEGAAP